MMNKLAIFDLDGTLFDTRDVNFKAYDYAFREYGYSLDRNKFIKEFNGRLYKAFMPEILGSEENMEDIHDLKVKMYPTFLCDAKMNRHLFEMIELIRKEYHIALVTTATYENAMQILEHFDVKDRFDLILTQRDVVNKKPDPEGFLKAMKHFDVKPEDTIVFEDAPVGIAAARAAGASILVVEDFKE